MARREHPRYENMEWPDWEYREYPMMVYPDASDPEKRKPDYHTEGRLRGKVSTPGVIVNNDDELGAVLAGDAEFDASTGKIVSDEDTRLAMIRECETLGVQIDKRWGIAKIEAALDAYTKARTEEVV